MNTRPSWFAGVLLLLAASMWGTAPSLRAEVLALYEFNNNLNSSATAANLTAGTFNDGPGYNTAGATGYSSGRRFVLSQAIQSSVATTCLSNGDYFEFTVTAASGQGLNLESLTFLTSRGSSSPDRVSVFSSVNNYATAILNAASVPSASTQQLVDLTGVEFQGLSSITFRVVFHGNGVNSTGTTARAHIDTVTLNGTVSPLITAQRWSSPATWGGTVPTAGQNVLIPADRTVLLDTTTASLGILEVKGTLRFDPTKDVHLIARHVIVTDGGRLEAGTPAQLYTRKSSITLTGTDPAANIVVHGHNTGSKGLIVMNGTLEIHGHRATAASWTKLAATANPGATQITVLNNATGWRVGDQIVIAPSGFNQLEAEAVTITAISGSTITFTPALQFKHWGQTQTVDGKVLDMRAEVALLTRDFVIQGDDTSPTNRFGGHVMIHIGGFARVQGVEFRRMGQVRKQGRYPFHWHFTGDASGQWIRNSSVNRSFHRAYITHQVDNAEVSNNVAFDVASHAFVFSEDLPEFNNVFRNNIGIVCRTLPKEDWAFVNSKGESSQSEKRGSTFWGRRPNQIMEFNVAAGTDDGQGFFYDPARKSTVANATVVSFTGNVAHSIGGELINNITYPPGSRGNGLFVHDYVPSPAAPQNYGDFFAYKCTAFGIWLERRDHFGFNSITADCGAGLLGYSANYSDILVVGNTANDVGGVAAPIGQVRKNPGVLGGANHGDAKRLRLVNVTFANVRDEAVFWWSDFTTHGMSAQGIRLINTPKRIYFTGNEVNTDAFYQPGFLFDKDGSLSGTGVPTALFKVGSPNVSANSVLVSDFNGYRHNVVADGAAIVLDNTASGVTATGTWTAATSPTGFFGTNFLSDGNTGKGTKSVAYTPNIPANAWYEVALYHPSGAGLANNVPVNVTGETGAGTGSYTLSYVVNQTTGGGAWRALDYQRFLAGSAGNVTLGTAGTTATVAADAVRFQRMRLQ